MNEERKYYQLTAKEATENLGTSKKGLPRDKSKERLKKYGKNELQGKGGVPKWLLFISQFRDVMVILLIVAGGISYFIGNFRDGTVMFIIVLVNAIIGFIQEYKAGKILDKLKDLIKSPVSVMIDGKLSEIPQDELVPGDIIKVETGDKIPADIRIIESFNLETNDFSLTGESMPQEKHSNAIKEKSILADRDNMAYLGTTVASGNALGIVVATGMNTEMGKIAAMTEETGKAESPLERELKVLGYRLTAIVLVLSVLLFFVSQLQGFSFFTSMMYALGVAVAAVPQALPAQVTVALSTASNRLANKKAVVKNLSSVETLGSTTVIATDKTGTLTKNEMTVTTVWFDGKEYEVTGVGYQPEGEIREKDGKPLSDEEIQDMEVMLDAATMASNAEIHEPDENHSSWYPRGDPTEAALITLSTKLGTRSPKEDEENPELHEFSFDSDRKRMSSVRQFEDSQVLKMKGGTDSVLSVSKYIYKNGKKETITEKDKENIRKLNEKYSSRALRVLAIAYRPQETDGSDYVMEEIEKDVIFLGLMGMIDPPKEGVKEAIRDCHSARIRTFIITGDHAITAKAVGKEIELSGEEEPLVVTGTELEDMNDKELSGILKKNESIIFSRVNPEDKLRVVKLLEEEKQIVAVTGDGVNDAPALKSAHIGVAMGKTGTDVAKEAAQLVLLDDSFPTLVSAVREGRTIYNNLRKTVLASMTTNGAELAIVLLGLTAVALKNWAIPILAIQILAIDLLAEIMPLTFLTYDPPPEGIMNTRPRNQKDYIINRFTALEVGLLGIIIGALAFTNFALFMFRNEITLNVGMEKTLLYAKATTISYLTIAYCQFANILSRRFEQDSIFSKNFWTNKILLWSIVGSIGMVFLGVYGPVIHEFLAFASISLLDWIYVLGAAAAYLGIFELMKMLKRRNILPAGGPAGKTHINA
ncbi:MAG: cation-transporting P-type ATPase [candidate division WOR-3 bacterium]